MAYDEVMASFSGVKRTDLEWQRRGVDELDLAGTRAAVVGGTGGLGRAIARQLAARGAHVTVVGQTFRDDGVQRLSFLKADLSSMREAARVGSELATLELDLVVLTTGIFAGKQREVTAEGLERDMAVSYLSRLQIVRRLAPALAARGGKKPRVFVMGFPGTTDKPPATSDLNFEHSYAAMTAHMATVAGNEALVLDSAKRYPAVSFFGLNPGLVKTDIRANLLGKGSLKHRALEALIGVIMPSAERYAERIVPLLVAPELEAHSGALFNAKGAAIKTSRGFSTQTVDELIRASEALIERAIAGPTKAA